jgi:hypothetical protein
METLKRFRGIFFIAAIISLTAFTGYKSPQDPGDNSFNPNSKKNCGTVEFNNIQMQRNPQFKINREEIERFTKEYVLDDNRSVVTIPVVFHVVYNTNEQNISDAQLMSQLEILNKDFNRLNADTVNTPAAFQSLAANVQVQFCLAQRDPSGNFTTGITRTMTSLTEFTAEDTSIYYTSLGGKDIWDRNKYLNIYSCKLAGTLLGYAQFPGGNPNTDGVVIGYNYMGNTGTVQPPNNLGRTASHEVGHWLNLFHIWGDEPACAQDDEIADTPLQGAESGGCPTFPMTDACSPNAPGIMFMNYMDYSDDNCMNMFTLGQSVRMNAALAGPRASLLTSDGCTSVGINQIGNEIPSSMKLAQNFPNPFNPTTKITFDISAGVNDPVKLAVYDLSGKEVAQLVNQNLQPGQYEYTFNGVNLASGMYFYKLTAGNFVSVKKMILVK